MTTVSPMNLAKGSLQSFLTSSGEKTYGESTAAGGVFGAAGAFAAARAASFSSASFFASAFTSETLRSVSLVGCGVRSGTGRGGEILPFSDWGDVEVAFAEMRK